MGTRRSKLDHERSREIERLIFETVDDGDPRSYTARKRAPKVRAALEHARALSSTLRKLCEDDRGLNRLMKVADDLDELSEQLKMLR